VQIRTIRRGGKGKGEAARPHPHLASPPPGHHSGHRYATATSLPVATSLLAVVACCPPSALPWTASAGRGDALPHAQYSALLPSSWRFRARPLTAQCRGNRMRRLAGWAKQRAGNHGSASRTTLPDCGSLPCAPNTRQRNWGTRRPLCRRPPTATSPRHTF
jgi:hypothetical protein